MEQSRLTSLFLSLQYAPIFDAILQNLSIKDLCYCLSTCKEGINMKNENREIQWLIEKRKNYIPEYSTSICPLKVPFHASVFEEACSLGYLKVVQWLLPFCRGVVSLQLGVQSALKGGQLKVAKYLYKDGGILQKPLLHCVSTSNNMNCINWVLKHYNLGEKSGYIDISVLLADALIFKNQSLYNRLLYYADDKGRCIREAEFMYLSTRDDQESRQQFESMASSVDEWVWKVCIATLSKENIDSKNLAFLLHHIGTFDVMPVLTCGAALSGKIETLEKLYRLNPHLKESSFATMLIIWYGNIELLLHHLKGINFTYNIWSTFETAALISGKLWLFDFIQSMGIEKRERDYEYLGRNVKRLDKYLIYKLIKYSVVYQGLR